MTKDQSLVVQQMLRNAIEEHQPIDVVKYLLQSGASPTELFDDGYNALHLLVANKNEKMVVQILNLCNEFKYLGMKGHNLNIRGVGGKTALHIAVEKKSLGIINKIWAAGCNLNVYDDDGYTPFHRAVEGGDFAIFNFLIARKVMVTTINKDGMTPFLSACRKGMFLFLEPLLKAGDNANQTSPSGSTGLHFAAIHGHIRTVSKLLECGTDPYVTNNDGKTALDCAKTHFCHDVIQILEKAMIDENPKVAEVEVEAEVPTFTLEDVKEWCSVNGYVLSKPI